MGRWEPNARGRLVEAAMTLFRERGYDHTTVEEIAAHVGLTERTFFRYFTDKREVLFAGSEALEALLTEHIAAAPAEMSAFDAVASALEQTAASLERTATLEGARARHALVSAHAELRERELIKLRTLAVAVADALRDRGVPAPSASLLADTGMAVFGAAFERWVEGGGPGGFAAYVRAAIEELASAVTVRTSPAASKARPSGRRRAAP